MCSVELCIGSGNMLWCCVLGVVMCSVVLCIGSGNVFSGVVYWEW